MSNHTLQTYIDDIQTKENVLTSSIFVMEKAHFVFISLSLNKYVIFWDCILTN
jgi:hypothetical protein